MRLPSLESLTLVYQENLELENGVTIADLIATSKTLKLIRMQKLESQGVETLSKALASNQSLPLEKLELGECCTFTDTAAENLAQFITHTCTLKFISISHGTFSVNGLLLLADALNHNVSLKEKIFKDQNFLCEVNGDGDVDIMAKILVQHPDVASNLNFDFKVISDSGTKVIADNLHQNFTIKVLSNNTITDDGAVALASAECDSDKTGLIK